VAEVDELAYKDAKLLPGNRRYRAIALTSALQAVAGGTGVKQLRTMHYIGRAAQHRLVLLHRSRVRLHAKRESNQD
jgi:hypothetical protein